VKPLFCYSIFKLFKRFSVFMDEDGRRFFSRMKNSGRLRKTRPNCQTEGQGWRRPSSTGMNQGRFGIRRFRRLFGHFLGAQKVTRRRNRGQPRICRSAALKLLYHFWMFPNNKSLCSVVKTFECKFEEGNCWMWGEFVM
jgi:hypothetical protein